MQWTYMLPTLRRFSRAQGLPSLPADGSGDYYWQPKTGIAGLYVAMK